MSEVNLGFTVSNNTIDFTVQPNEITITPTDIQLSIYTSGAAVARGSNTQVQYNNQGILDGSSSFVFHNSNSTVVANNFNSPNVSITGGNINVGNLTATKSNFGNVGNVTITGGLNGYVLQTDGTGNLDWTAMGGGGGGNGTPGGSNTQVQYNDGGSFGGNSGFTFNEVTGNVNIPGNLILGGLFVGAIANANYSNFSGLVTTAYQPNITRVGNLSELTVTSNNIALEYIAGANSQGVGGIAIGANAGGNSQGVYGVAIGWHAGANSQDPRSVAIGQSTAQENQGDNSVAIGTEAGRYNQSPSSVAIGVFAGLANQGNYAVAIGGGAGSNNQPDSTIILNAQASALDATIPSSFYVKPVRSLQAANVLYYDSVTGEVTYNPIGQANANNANYANFAGQVINSSQPNITSLGTLTSLAVSTTSTLGNSATANFFIGSGNNLSNIQGANVSGVINFANYVVQASQTNITRVGTLSSLSVTGNVTANNFVGNLTTNSNIQGNLSGWALNVRNGAQPNITSVGTLTSLSVTGNVTANNFVGNFVGNISNSNYAFYSGNVVINAQPNITSVGTLTSLSVSGNVTARQFISNVATGNAPFIVTSTTPVANLTVGNANFSSYSDTVTNLSQPNITGLGILTSLNVSGNVLLSGANLAIGQSTTSNVELRANNLITLNGANGVMSGGAIKSYFNYSNIASGNATADVANESQMVNTTNLLGNISLNIRGSANVPMSTYLDNRERVTFNYVFNNGVGTNYYPNVVTIDNVAPTLKYLNNSQTPTANRTSVYTYNITRDNSSNFIVYVSIANFTL